MEDCFSADWGWGWFQEDSAALPFILRFTSIIMKSSVPRQIVRH